MKTDENDCTCEFGYAGGHELTCKYSHMYHRVESEIKRLERVLENLRGGSIRSAVKGRGHMNRRDFLRTLSAATLAAYDWDRLLWVPRQMVVVPAMPLDGFDIGYATWPTSTFLQFDGMQLEGEDYIHFGQPLQIEIGGSIRYALKDGVLTLSVNDQPIFSRPHQGQQYPECTLRCGGLA